MRKIWAVWCKGVVQCFMMGELKQIRISSLKSLIIASLLCIVKLWLVHPSEFKSLKGTKNEEHMRLELERVWSYFFKTFEPKLSLILFLCFLCCSFTSDAQKTFVTHQFAHQYNKNHSIWLRNVENIEKCSTINTCLVMGSFILLGFKHIK
jgi:hypothetical protein